MVSMAETRKRRDPQLHRRRSRGDHAAGQPVHLPHQLHADHRDAEGRALHREQPEGEDGGGDLRQQRLRQGRARRDHQGARSRGRQGRGRHLDRPGPGRLLRAGAARPSRATPTRCSSTPTRKSRRARCASCASRATTKPIVGETTLTGQKVIELAGDAANGAVAHVGLTVDAPQPGDARLRRQVREGIQVHLATTTASRATPACTS